MIRNKIIKILPYLLILVGIGLVLFAFAADFLLGDNQTGFGVKQKIITVIGGFILIGGIFLALPIGQRVLRVIFSPPEQYRRPIPIFLLAVWFGLITGFAEVSILVYRKYLQIQVLNRSKEFFWMVPLGEIIIFSVAGLFLYLLTRLWGKSDHLDISVLIFSFMGFSSVLFLLSGLHILAVLLLSFGLALTLARFIHVRSGRFYGFARLTFPGLLFILGVLFIGSYGRNSLEEQLALARLPSTPPNSPNVLLIVLDTVRAESLSAYGYERVTTPNMEKMAKNGVLFQNAFASAPWTLPSHQSMFTGLWLHEQYNLPPNSVKSYPTLAEVHTANGYYSAGFVANTFMCSYEHGLDRGFAHYEDYEINVSQILFNTSFGKKLGDWIEKNTNYRRFIYYTKTAGDVNKDFLNWIDRHADRPFFVFLNYFDAHSPYQPPKPFNTMFGSQRPPAHTPLDLYYRGWNQDEMLQTSEVYIDAYDGSIAYLDQQLDQLYNELEKRDLIDNTLIIITSDHGELFGEHGLFEHGNSLYIQSLHVPLLILFPNEIPEDYVVSSPVSLRDLFATVVEFTGVETSNEVFGNSLSRYWNEVIGKENPGAGAILSELDQWVPFPKQYPISRGDMESIFYDKYHYILNGDGQEELFNFKVDPAEEFDLANNSEEANTLEHIRSMLEEMISTSILPVAGPHVISTNE